MAKVSGMLPGSKLGFDDALKPGIFRMNDSVNGATGASIQDQRVVVGKGGIVGCRAVLKARFIVQAKAKAPARKK